MSVRVREGLADITANVGFNNYNSPIIYQVGKVYATMLNPESVPTRVWEANGGWSGVGTILFDTYNPQSEIDLADLNDEKLASLTTALPLLPYQKYFPLPGEVVLLFQLPAAPSPITNKAFEIYYLSPINAWNSSQFNGLFLDGDKQLLKDYESFTQNDNFRGVQPFVGDNIIEGRFGNSLRFGSTNRSGGEDLTPWSTNPSELQNNPIVILSNDHNFKISGSDMFVEDINKDGSSLYLTSQQFIPLNIGNVRLSNITSPISVQEYNGSQAILNADRTIISSKSNEVLVFGRTGVEVYSQGPVYLQSNTVGITLQGNSIFLGPSSNNETTQPLVLGNNLEFFLGNLMQSLSDFCKTIANVKSTPEGTIITGIATAATALQAAIVYVNKDIEKGNLLSKITFTQ
jgi:hypothetical protein